ncbi:MAG: shikimate kinase [Oscillospiraceae bacterium]|nr:shikimate kinase [Oscillospiraceae bacterium]
MRRFGLLGERLSHSYSPMIHAELGDYEYGLYERSPDGLEGFLTGGGFDGLNVTIPYKEAIVPFCGALSETARAVGSVNTVTRLADGTLYGDNTDLYGFSYLLRKSGADPAAGKTLVLGGGGSSLAVRAALRGAGAGDVVVVSRGGPVNYGNVADHCDAALIVNATPVGMHPDADASPLADLSLFKDCKAVIDLIYNPARTRLLLQAEELGVPGVNGLPMLVAQAVKSSESFTGIAIDAGAIDRIVGKVARLTRNVVLIGMPGCGKTSVGAALARMMGRGFEDTDEWVAKAAGRPIPEIIAEDGEEAFRRMESEALVSICGRGGLVVATGGGVVTRRENKGVIRRNAYVVYLDRRLSELPTEGRPLSGKEGVEALAKARLPLYSSWCDLTVPVDGVGRTAAKIMEQCMGGLAQ